MPEPMKEILDLDRFPLDQTGTPERSALVDHAKAALARNGLFNLNEFMRSAALTRVLAQLRPRFATRSFHHKRSHNIYFKDTVDGVKADDPALRRFETSNHTLCHDDLTDTALDALYRWQPFADFLADVMDQPALHVMDDPLAGVNVMEYRDGEALNWHFDRSIFTTTLLLQEPSVGGAFEYVRDLRSADHPNLQGVADLLSGAVKPTRMQLSAGTLNVFKGVTTAHRVSPVSGSQSRIITVFSYYDRPGVTFTPAERMGFYGRVA